MKKRQNGFHSNMGIMRKIRNVVRSEISRLRGSEFVKNVSTMMTGTALSQFVPVLISPILTRIYMPEDFGILTVFLSYSMIISTVITGKYEMAIMLPKSEDQAINLSGLATLLTVFFSSLLLIAVILFKDNLVLLPGADKIRNWILIIPVTVGLVAYGNILNYWVSRNKNFKAISKGKFIQTFTSSGFNIGFGLINPLPLFLILGNLLGQSLNAIYLTWLIIKHQRNLFQHFSWKSITSVGKTYLKFPLFDIPNSLSYSISTQGMNLVFSKFFGDVVLGYFSMVQRILITPFSFISLSFTQVFFEKMSSVYNHNRAEFNKYLKKAQDRLIIYFFVPFFAFVFLSPLIIPFIFGSQWKLMYRYVFVLSPMIFFNLTTSPYTYIFKILNKQEIALVVNILRMVLLIAAVMLGNMISKDPIFIFTLFSLTSIFITSISIVICSRYLVTKLSSFFKLQLIILAVLNIVIYYFLKINIL
jgi:O-antigen/teichoic acid export membrane protein